VWSPANGDLGRSLINTKNSHNSPRRIVQPLPGRSRPGSRAGRTSRWRRRGSRLLAAEAERRPRFGRCSAGPAMAISSRGAPKARGGSSGKDERPEPHRRQLPLRGRSPARRWRHGSGSRRRGELLGGEAYHEAAQLVAYASRAPKHVSATSVSTSVDQGDVKEAKLGWFGDAEPDGQGKRVRGEPLTRIARASRPWPANLSGSRPRSRCPDACDYSLASPPLTLIGLDRWTSGWRLCTAPVRMVAERPGRSQEVRSRRAPTQSPSALSSTIRRFPPRGPP
jgi:hypothetical protein